MKKLFTTIFPFGWLTALLEVLLVTSIFISLKDPWAKGIALVLAALVYTWAVINYHYKQATTP